MTFFSFQYIMVFLFPIPYIFIISFFVYIYNIIFLIFILSYFVLFSSDITISCRFTREYGVIL